MIISKLSIDNAVKRQIYSTSFEDKDFLGSKEFISKDSKKQSFSLKNHFINLASSSNEKPSKIDYKDETLLTNDNKRKDDIETNNYSSFTHKDSLKVIDSSDFFRKSNKLNSTSHFDYSKRSFN